MVTNAQTAEVRCGSQFLVALVVGNVGMLLKSKFAFGLAKTKNAEKQFQNGLFENVAQ